MLFFLFAMFAISDPGPVVETCDFLPARHQCHYKGRNDPWAGGRR